jgi:hypothetical protein
MLLAIKVSKFHLAPKISCMENIWNFSKRALKEEYGC